MDLAQLGMTSWFPPTPKFLKTNSYVEHRQKYLAGVFEPCK